MGKLIGRNIDLLESTVKYHEGLRNVHEGQGDFEGYRNSTKFIDLAKDIAMSDRRKLIIRNLELEKMAYIDNLTGSLNRNGFYDKVNGLQALCRRNDEPESVLMIDGDKFKRVNDTYGHPVGDEVLKYLANEIEGSVRASDVVGRYGGEEFAVYLPNTDLNGAARVAAKINENIGSKEAPHGEIFTVSIGVAEIKDGKDVNIGLDGADKALYEAKDTGRNKFVLYKN